MTIGFIGAGNMGGALATSVFFAAVDANLLIADVDTIKAEALAGAVGGQVVDNATLAAQCDYIFLGVKPQMMKDMLTDLKPSLKAMDAAILNAISELSTS